MQQPQKPTSFRDIDFSHYFRHYLNLIWRWKMWIVISGPLVFGVALGYKLVFASPKPVLDATALIGLENVKSMTAVMDFMPIDDGKIEIIRTRNFLKDIVTKLSLRVGVKNYSRHAIFSEILVDSLAKPGKYAFAIDKENTGKYTITLITGRFSYNDRVIQSGKVAALNTIDLPGVRLRFSELFLKNPHDVTFYVARQLGAIEALRNSMTIKKPDPRRQRYHIEVSVQGRDRILICEKVNGIADAFVEKRLQFKKRKTQNVLVVLEKQFEKARMGLEEAENRLKYFRSSNPTIGLTSGAQQTVNTMIAMESNTLAIENAMNEAENLRLKYLGVLNDDKLQVAEEILIFLNARNNTTAPVLQMELHRLLVEKRTLEPNYVGNHPLIQKNKAAIDKLHQKVGSTLANFLMNSKEKLQNKASGIQTLSKKLQRLPSKELRLAEMQRQHQVNAQIYSRVLDRYNQAKVAENVEVADAYVMDYAIPPVAPPTNILLIFGICLLIGLAVALCPPIVVDMISKTVRTEFELCKMTDMLVLEAIPEIIPAKRKDENSRKK